MNNAWWLKRLKDFSDLIKRGFPYIVLSLGLILTIFGEIQIFKNEVVNRVVASLGKVFLGSGLFTFMIKSFQYTGIFKEELTKVIFEPKYIENRKDLAKYWTKLSKELFKDKFPAISEQLLNDIRNKYMPTNHIIYYDNVEHLIQIRLDNPSTGESTLERQYTLTAIPENPNECHTYGFSVNVPYKENESEVSFETEIYINNIKIDQSDFREISSETQPVNAIIRKFEIDLIGEKQYFIKRREIIKYNLYFDNIIYFQANKICNNLRVEIHYPKNLLNIDLKKCGALGDFVKDHDLDNSARFSHNKLIYPEQGYYLNIKPKTIAYGQTTKRRR
jgi:hypothetical protein